MGRIWFFIFLMGVAAFGYWTGLGPQSKKDSLGSLPGICPSKDFPLTEHKSFAVVIYAYNQSLWCQRALRSVFEQDFDYYRVIFIDDGSTDGTSEIAQQFIVDNHQDHRVIVIRNEQHLGPVACLYRAIDSCLDKEIIIPLDAKDWLAHSMTLTRQNAIYQNPDVWMTFGQSIQYPSYEIFSPILSDLMNRKGQFHFPCSFYSALFKEIHLQDLFKKGLFAKAKEAFLIPLIELSGGRYRILSEPITFFNAASSFKVGDPFPICPTYMPLVEFPKPREPNLRTDILLFSYNRPMQLYACLESMERYVSGFEKISVLYRADDSFVPAYENVKEAFPHVHFSVQGQETKYDFKSKFMKVLFDSPSEYVLFAVDDLIVKDFVDLKLCMNMMEKTRAYGFYLRFGKHVNHSYQLGRPQEVPPSVPLASGVYAWDICNSQSDWGFPNSLDLTLFRKSDIKEAFSEMRYATPNSLEYKWAQKYMPEEAIGLYFETSKMVNLPLNIVGKSGNPCNNSLDTKELLAKFNEGLKIDIEPLYKIENASPHYDYVPEFVLR